MDISGFIIIEIQTAIGSSFYFYWLERVWSRAHPADGLLLTVMKAWLWALSERESTGFVKRVIIFQKHFTKSILPEAFCFAGDLSREAFPGSIFLAGACL